MESIIGFSINMFVWMCGLCDLQRASTQVWTQVNNHTITKMTNIEIRVVYITCSSTTILMFASDTHVT